MVSITITDEDIRQAADYLANAVKEQWVSETAPKCLDKYNIEVDGEALPPMYAVNSGRKARYLMAAFCMAYLRKEVKSDKKDGDLMDEEEYDLWAGNHVFCQINRLKSNIAVKDKCFDILSDYADLEKRLSTQINALLAVQNDSVMRQAQYNKAAMKELPEVIGELQKLRELKGEANAD